MNKLEMFDVLYAAAQHYYNTNTHLHILYNDMRVIQNNFLLNNPLFIAVDYDDIMVVSRCHVIGMVFLCEIPNIIMQFAGVFYG